MTYTVEIPLKLPSLNDYIRACRTNAYAGAKLKSSIEEQIGWYLVKLPKLNPPIFVEFIWVEGNHKRDLDNASFGKKFILDAMVKMQKIPDDNQHNVVGFKDQFEHDKQFKVIMTIQEV